MNPRKRGQKQSSNLHLVSQSTPHKDRYAASGDTAIGSFQDHGRKPKKRNMRSQTWVFSTLKAEKRDKHALLRLYLVDLKRRESEQTSQNVCAIVLHAEMERSKAILQRTHAKTLHFLSGFNIFGQHCVKTVLRGSLRSHTVLMKKSKVFLTQRR